MQSSNIADYLTAMAQQQPGNLAIAVQQPDDSFKEYSYRQLDEASDRIARGLAHYGIVPGARTVVMERPGFEFFAVVFALFKIGAVLVAVDPGIGLKHLNRCLADARPQAFIGNRKAHLARFLFGWASTTLQTLIVTGNKFLLLPGIIKLQQLMQAGSRTALPAKAVTDADQMAAILFTSGSTGSPKGAVYTHQNFLAQVQSLKDLYDIRPGEIDIATFPLFALYAPAMGMTSIIPDMDFTRPGSVEPSKIFTAIEKYSATTMFGSPALLDRISHKGAGKNIRLPTLKRVLSAGAPVAPAILERFSKLLNPDVQIYTPYGATESLPVSSIGSFEVLQHTRAATEAGKGICVGKPVAGIEVSIIAISDKSIPRWDEAIKLGPYTTGEIVVRGPQVTRKYYNRPEATLMAKIFGDQGELYHRMGDTGYLDDSGRLWFCGRKSDRVVDYDKTWFSVCCEGVFNAHEKVYRTALVGLRRKGTTVPALCVQLEPAHLKTDTRALKWELLRLGIQHEHTRVIRDIYIHPGFPVDIRHNAKIDRAKLARWASKQR